MTIITDLSSLATFVEELIGELPGTLAFVVIGNGEDAIDDIQAYYAENAGVPTAFLQLAETEKVSNGHGADGLTVFCGVTIAEKPLSRLAIDRMASRDSTLKAMLHLVGLLEMKMEESQQDTDDSIDGYEVALVLNRNRILPIGKIANVFLEGWYIDLDVTIPANHLLFPD